MKLHTGLKKGDAHIPLHEEERALLNALHVLVPDDDLQLAVASGGRVFLTPGTYHADVLTLTTHTQIIGAEGVVICCQGIAAYTDALYLNLVISDVVIQCSRSSGDVGLSLYGCKAQLTNVFVRYGFNVGLRLELSLLVQMNHCRFEGIVNGCLITGDTNTTISAIDTYFRRSNDAALRIEASTTDVALTHCVFEDSQRGVVADGVNVLTLTACYWEACYQQHLVVGEVTEVGSVTIMNPLMVGHQADNIECELTRIDDVQQITWIGGNCKLPRIAWIHTTERCRRAFLIEPNHLGLTALHDAPEHVVAFGANGRLQINHLQLEAWSWMGDYYLSPQDMTVASGGNVALYANQSGAVRLAAQRNGQGQLIGGVEMDAGGHILSDSNGKRYRLTVGTNGALSTSPMP